MVLGFGAVLVEVLGLGEVLMIVWSSMGIDRVEHKDDVEYDTTLYVDIVGLNFSTYVRILAQVDNF